MRYIQNTALVVLTLLAALSDIRKHKVSNRLTLPGIIAGLIVNVIKSGLRGIAVSAVGIIIPLIILFIPFILRMIGAGDIKLLSAIGSLIGVYGVFYIFFIAVISGAVIGIIKLVCSRNHDGRQIIAFAVPVFIGTIIYLGGLV